MKQVVGGQSIEGVEEAWRPSDRCDDGMLIDTFEWLLKLPIEQALLHVRFTEIGVSDMKAPLTKTGHLNVQAEDLKIALLEGATDAAKASGVVKWRRGLGDEQALRA